MVETTHVWTGLAAFSTVHDVRLRSLRQGQIGLIVPKRLLDHPESAPPQDPGAVGLRLHTDEISLGQGASNQEGELADVGAAVHNTVETDYTEMLHGCRVAVCHVGEVAENAPGKTGSQAGAQESRGPR